MKPNYENWTAIFRRLFAQVQQDPHQVAGLHEIKAEVDGLLARHRQYNEEFARTEAVLASLLTDEDCEEMLKIKLPLG